jgi:hypothetical protein
MDRISEMYIKFLFENLKAKDSLDDLGAVP